MTEKEQQDLIHEVEIISNLENPHIVKFYETFHDKFYFHIVTELCTCIDSDDWMPNDAIEKISTM